MSRLTSSALVFVACLFCYAGDTNGQLPSADDANNPELQKKRQAKVAWLKKTLQEPYERLGKKDPKWDAAAREALEVAVRYWSQPRPLGDDRGIAVRAARRALNAGCSDPLIKYVLAAVGDNPKASSSQIDRLASEAAEGMEASDYPAIIRCKAFAFAAYRHTTAKQLSVVQQKEARRLMDAALALLPEILLDNEAKPAIQDLCARMLQGYQRLDGDRSIAYQKIAAILEKDQANQALALAVKGHFLVKYAWDARGADVADRVTEQQFQKFKERLTQANEVLEKAWQLDPSNATVAVDGIQTEMGLGQGRQRMETWFQRAMKADPDCYDACGAKLLYLEPKWNGTPEEMVAFGRECVKTQNWYARLPQILVEAHLRMSRYVKDPDAYYSHPQIWEDVQSYFVPYLKVYPESKHDRALYGRLAFLCQRYAVANEQFQMLGKEYWQGELRNNVEYQKMAAEAKKRVGEK